MPAKRRTSDPIRRQVGVPRARLAAAERTIRARQREIEALHRIAALAQREQPLRTVLQEVVQEVSACTGYPIVAIEFYDEAQQLMEFAAATGIPLAADQIGLCVPVAQTLSGLVARSGQALIETHAQERPEYAAEALRVLGVQTFLCVPLTVAARVIGTLALAHPTAHSLDAQLVPLAHSLANVIAALVARRQAEERSMAAERQLREILDKLAAGVLLMDADGRYLFANQRAAAMFGLTSAEVIGKALGDVLPPEVAQHYLERNRHFITTQGFAEYEATFDLPVGTRTFFIADQVLGNAEGAGEHLLSSLIDITARTQAEAALHQAIEDLTRSNADLEQFAYVASHDLQEPLRAVTGMVQLLQQRYQGQLDARADQYIGLAVEAAARMQALINDLLTFSRLQRRGRPFAPTTVASVLESALTNLQVSIDESAAVITFANLPTVQADAAQLVQLFQNLISNAIKFRGKEPPCIHISAERREAAWCFAVRDNGIGVAPDYFERIFVIFQRLHPRRAYPGTGIGLALCKKIVERHGGQIWVESYQGLGATFFFTIPDRS
jgi:PAS domain S-box-containing protein